MRQTRNLSAMSISEEVQPHVDFLIGIRLITEVLHPVKSGKEATVYVCRAHPETGREYFALKVYKELTKRSFRNDSTYQEARLYRNNRVTRAFEQKSEFGQSVQFGLWVGMEFENLRNLFEAGVYVPEPIKQVGPTILMEFYGRNGAAATLLQNARLSQQQAREVWTLLKANIEMMLGANVVHGDLSPYNILVDATNEADPVRIIDFPQAVDARFNPNAKALLERDIQNTLGFFNKLGVRESPAWLARDLWRRWQRAEL